MKFFFPMLALIGVVILMGGAKGKGTQNARMMLAVIGFMLLLAIVFGFVVKRAI